MDKPVPTNVPALPGGPTDWGHAFKVLCTSLGRQWIGSDLLYFVAADVKEHAGREAVKTMVDMLALNRDKNVQDFMG